MKELFRFDVRLKDLMNLGEQALNFSKLKILFGLLDQYWYNLDDDVRSEERRNRIRIGSVEVFLDDDGALHMDFITRFGFNSDPKIVKILEEIGSFEDSTELLSDQK